MSSSRQNLFKLSTRYAARTAIPQWPGSAFQAGEILTFVAYKYSRYDNASVYEFKNEQGELKEWWLGDEQPLELSMQLFDEITDLR